MKRLTQKQFALCVQNRGHKASLEIRKIYQILPDAKAADQGLLRVIDESGEDYLYPDRFFVNVSIPSQHVRKLFSRISRSSAL